MSLFQQNYFKPTYKLILLYLSNGCLWKFDILHLRINPKQFLWYSSTKQCIDFHVSTKKEKKEKLFPNHSLVKVKILRRKKTLQVLGTEFSTWSKNWYIWLINSKEKNVLYWFAYLTSTLNVARWQNVNSE